MCEVDVYQLKPKLPATLLALAGILLVGLGLFHLGVWLVVGGSLDGPVSWRKPILFGLSTGMTVLSLAWICPKLRPRPLDAPICGLFSMAMVLEVGLITLQQWRGQASHFNQSTPFDATVEDWMTYLITFATAVLLDFTWRSFRQLNAPADTQLAVRIGLSLLIVSCLIGFGILAAGKYQAGLGKDPSTWGKAGVTKFPHGIAIHALQFLPLLCWLMKTMGISTTVRIRLVAFSGASVAVLLVFSLVQTIQGRSRLDIGLFGAILLVLGIGLMFPLAVHLIGRCFGIIRRDGLPNVRKLLVMMSAMIACCCGPRLAAAQNWPQWGGPRRDFQLLDSTAELITKNSDLREKWRMPLGAGNSGICVRDESGFVCFSRDGKEHVVAFSTNDGQEIWHRDFEISLPDFMDLEFGSGPHSTPLVTDRLLFFIGSTGDLVALDIRTGETVWQCELWANGKQTRLERGYAASPVAFNESIIVPVGGDRQSVQCFSMAEGKVRWKKHDYECSYASPLIATIAGRSQVVLLMGQDLIGLDPETGELLWEHPAPASNYANCTSPVVGPDDRIYFNLREGMRGLQLSFENDRFEVREAWASRIAIAQTANMVLHEGTIFGSKEGGVFAAIDALTGETKWQSREPGNCRFIAAKNHLMALGESGQLSLWKVLPDHIEPVWQEQVLSGRCWVGPIVAGGLVIVRDSGHLIAFEGS